jgi:MFS transporter, PHS family, inorganic phosphate transporter
LTFFFANYGPNTTTFVLPSLVYSPECRSTFNGLSAAAGKLGALTGASLFEPAANRLGDATVMMLCALIAGVSLIITKAFVPQSVGRRHADDQPHQHEPLSTAQSPVRNTIV